MSSQDSEHLFWPKLDAINLPGSLNDKISLFKSHAKITYMEEEIFMHYQWVSAFIGLGFWPENYDLFLDAFDFSKLQQQYKEMLGAINHTVSQLPEHLSYINEGLKNN